MSYRVATSVLSNPQRKTPPHHISRCVPRRIKVITLEDKAYDAPVVSSVLKAGLLLPEREFVGTESSSTCIKYKNTK